MVRGADVDYTMANQSLLTFGAIEASDESCSMALSAAEPSSMDGSS